MRNLLFTAFILAGFMLVGVAWSASAQITQDKDIRVRFAQMHVSPTSRAVHKTFWIDALGGSPAKVGTLDAVTVADGLIVLGADTHPTGGTKTSTINHVGFTVPDVRATVARVKAAGFAVITRAELPAQLAVNEKDGVAVIPDQNSTMALVMGPDDIKVELIEAKTQKAPIAMHHIHFASPDVAGMQAWYAKLLDAKPVKQGSLDTVSVHGAMLIFPPAAGPVVGTKGRVLDHIGFEVRDLEAFTKQLEAAGIKFETGYRKTTLAGLGEFRYAALTDPWGTSVQLSEGLDQVR